MFKKRLLAVFLCICFLLPSISQITANAGKYYLLWPVPGHYALTSCYGDNRNHWAIDIGAPTGTPIIASAAGQVTAIYTGCTHNYGKRYNCCDSRGNYVLIRNSSLINGKVADVRYIHMTRVDVRVGQYVSAGQQIGTIGTTGYSTGPHLDFKLSLGGVAVDPGPYLQIPSGLYYSGSNWSCCGPYIAKLKSYNNTEYDPGTGGSNLTLKAGYNYPILILRGSNFTVGGSISSSKNITYVEARIITPEGKVRHKASASPNSTSYELSNLASSLRFRLLNDGHYAYEIIARDESMTSNYQLLYSPFTVSSKASIAPMQGLSYPTALKPGQSFSLKGTIASIYPLTSVRISIVSASGETKISQSRNPNSTLFDISTIDSLIKFNTLTEGTYYYRVTATDNQNTTVTVLDQKFYVSNKTPILGEAFISGFFLTPTPNRALNLQTDLEPKNAQYSIQWYADNQPIQGANSSTFIPTMTHRNKAISVKLFGAGNYIGEVESLPTNKVFALTDHQFRIDLISQTISPAPSGTTVKSLLDNLISDFIFTGIYSPDGRQLSEDEQVFSGCELKSMLLGVTLLRYYVVVQGDLNGDNRVTATDARLALRSSAKLENLKAFQQKAADLNGDGNVSASDARQLLRISASLDSLPPLL